MFQFQCLVCAFPLDSQPDIIPQPVCAGLEAKFFAIVVAVILFWWFRDGQAALAVLTPEQLTDVKAFNAAFAALPWRPIEGYPDMGDVDGAELSVLLPTGRRLLQVMDHIHELHQGEAW